MNEADYIAIAYISAFGLGMICQRYRRLSKWLLLLAIPFAWLFATWAPEFSNLPKANDDGFINFYVQLYEKASPAVLKAVLISVGIFLLGRLAYYLYDVFIVQTRVESPADKKRRIRAMYDMGEFD